MSLLTVCSSSTYESLASLESLKSILEISTTGSDDLLISILGRATESVEKFLGRPLRKQTYYEKVASYGSMFLHVNNTPIQSVSRILLDDILISPTEYEIGDREEGAVYRQFGWAWSAGVVTDLVPHVVPGTERLSFAIEYVGGYVPSTSTSTMIGVPKTIEQATLEIAKSWYLGRKRDGAVASKRVGDLEIQYGSVNSSKSISSGLPSIAEDLLKSFSRIV